MLKHKVASSLLSVGLVMPVLVGADSGTVCSPLLDFSLRELDGEHTVNLCEDFGDKLVLVVNTASHCGYTPQFKGLEQLYRQYQGRGFVVLGLPSNDFGGQDPDSESDIARFCNQKYDVTFPMFEKTHAAKGKASPFYQRLGEAAREYPQWNFHKYLISRGELVASFASEVKPEDSQIVSMIEDFLPVSQP
ncbi:MAG TPA: glutathione peroxidase [Thiolinea sp.]|nr:glutathione peroxidase [Thiolinea sp.]